MNIVQKNKIQENIIPENKIQKNKIQENIIPENKIQENKIQKNIKPINIREYLLSYKLITDGAFGTYYASLCNDSNEVVEEANIKNKELVRRIHREYLEAGAKLIRTNTFASNTVSLHNDFSYVKENIVSGYQIAKEVCKDRAFVGADIGPIVDETRTREEIQKEYKAIAEVFLDCGADIFVFETFDELEILLPVIEFIKNSRNDVFIIVQFAINQHGYTESGISGKRLLEESDNCLEIDAVGFNCGVGPSHLLQLLKKMNITLKKYMTALPNSSYPQICHNRMVFQGNEVYFAEKLKEIVDLGIDIFGGCCGTTPAFIKRIKNQISVAREQDFVEEKRFIKEEVKENNTIFQVLGQASPTNKVIAVELDPPLSANDEKILEAANYLKHKGVDILTFADSPSGRTRADSILMSVKVESQVNIPVMPHICCRDKNRIAISSQILGAHMNGIRNLLLITGDPVPSFSRKNIKSVFNFDSIRLMELVGQMNEEHFSHSPICYGGAINYARRNIEVEIQRMKDKVKAGATFFLTQPLFSKEDVDIIRMLKQQVDAKILVGLMPLVSRKNALFIQNEIAGIRVPDEVVDLYREDMTRQEGEAVGVSIAKRMIEESKDFVDGYYFVLPFNRVTLVERVLDNDEMEGN